MSDELRTNGWSWKVPPSPLKTKSKSLSVSVRAENAQFVISQYTVFCHMIITVAKLSMIPCIVSSNMVKVIFYIHTGNLLLI